MRIFAARIHDALERSHVFITSREDAWRALPDQTLVEQHLPYGEPGPVAEQNGGEARCDPTLKLFRLAGLSQDEIALFASHYGIGDVDHFVDAIKRGDRLQLAERPFDLKALIAVWIADQKLGSRFDVLQRMIGLQLGPVVHASAAIRIDSAKARDGIRVLAGAVMLTGKFVISLPDGVRSSDRLDPQVLLPDWTAAEIDALLRTGLFDDVVYTSVRFRHREIRDLLSAEWANFLLGRPGGHERVERLFFRESHGEEIIVPRTRPILPWLILLDDEVRDKALSLAPEIASEGGDPSHLPIDVRRRMLRDIVEGIFEGSER